MSLRDIPIRRKLMIIILATSVVVMVVMRLAFFTYEFVTFRQATLRQLSMLGEIIASNSTAALAFDNTDDAAEILSALRVEQHIAAACLYDRNGRIFSKYPAGLPDGELPPSPGAIGFQFQDGALSGFRPVLQADQRLGTLYLKLDTAAIMHDWLLGSLGLAGIILALVLLMAFFVSRGLQKHISQPVIDLAETARAVSERRDYSVRAPKLGRDELGLLTEAFNQMLDELQMLYRDQEKRVQDRTVQLEVANRELEAFSYSVSHDLRAPLRHIDGFAQMLQKRANGSLDETGQRYLATIISSSKGLGTLIDELLTFSRMGRAELKQVPADFGKMVEEVRHELQHDSEGRRIDWQVDELPVVEADPATSRQVWRNLLGNAVKYTRGREVAKIAISYRLDPADGHVFTVKDNGAGFDMQYVDKLFGVFQRLHSNTEFEGTGIGLAHVRRIVLRHGGRIWAEGAVDQGATFHFTLPAANKGPDSHVITSATPPPHE